MIIKNEFDGEQFEMNQKVYNHKIEMIINAINQIM